MSDKEQCARCNEPVEHIDNIMGYSFWGIIQQKVETTVRKSISIASMTVRHDDRGAMRTDEETPLCDPCFGLLVGRFLQGRDVVALNHEHVWSKMGKFPLLERCSLCYKTCISTANVEIGRRPEDECPGCDYPVGYAPHNGRGDCPTRDVEVGGPDGDT